MGRDTSFYIRKNNVGICVGWFQNWKELEDYITSQFTKSDNEYEYKPTAYELEKLILKIEPFYRNIANKEKWEIDSMNEGVFDKSKIWKSTDDFNPRFAGTFNPVHKLIQLYYVLNILLDIEDEIIVYYSC